jgi:apolipoprotein N-acyltransferase
VVAPLAALAQFPGTVITSPLGAAAPAVGMPMLVLLALALSVGAVYVLRRKAASTTARLALVAAAIIVASIAYATIPMPSVVVSGEQCAMRTTQTWNAATPTELDNQCSNALLIEAIATQCPEEDGTMGTAGGKVDALPSCVPGQTLAAGAACDLPVCLR